MLEIVLVPRAKGRCKYGNWTCDRILSRLSDVINVSEFRSVRREKEIPKAVGWVMKEFEARSPPGGWNEAFSFGGPSFSKANAEFDEEPVSPKSHPG